MKTPKRPDMKMPELKVPGFASDLYYDLRDRRLLPLIALVVVAIAAVPFLLGGKDEGAYVAPSGTALSTLGSGSETSKLTVVEATPGLRDYRKRLADRSPTNPFKQRYTGLPKSAQVEASGVGASSAESAGESSSGGSAGSETEVTETVVHPGPAGASPGNASPGNSPAGGAAISPTTPGLHFFGYRPDVRFGAAGSGKLNDYERLPVGKVLPAHNPVLVFIGVSEDGKRAIFDIPGRVAWVRGSGKCGGGKRSCKVIMLRAGQAVDVITGDPNRNFRLAVKKIDFVEVDRSKQGKSVSPANRKNPEPVQDFIK